MSKKRLCPACDRSFVKGARVLFAARTGARSATVCKRCADGGTLIVQDKSGDLSKCIRCEENAAVVCLACALRGAK